MINKDGNYVCDFCRGMSGEFSTTTSNHVSCEENDKLEKANKLLQSTITAQADVIRKIAYSIKSLVDDWVNRGDDTTEIEQYQSWIILDGIQREILEGDMNDIEKREG